MKTLTQAYAEFDLNQLIQQQLNGYEALLTFEEVG
jgi:acetyl-CoA synthetase